MHLFLYLIFPSFSISLFILPSFGERKNAVLSDFDPIPFVEKRLLWNYTYNIGLNKHKDINIYYFLRFFKLNLGTEAGQMVYSTAMIILPMIPLLILIGQTHMIPLLIPRLDTHDTS